MSRLLRALLAIGLIMSLSTPALACVGARAMSMGGAFTGLADDVNAVYWNPAGLTQIEDKQITFTTTLANRDEVYYDDFIAFALPIEAAGTFGVSLINSGYDTSPVYELVDRWLVFSYGRGLGENFSLGANIRYRSIEVSRFGFQDDDTTIEIDLGVFWKLTDIVSVGLLIQNFNEPKLKLLGVKYKYIRNVRPGIALKPDDKTTLTLEMYDAFGETEDEAVDVSQDLRLGIEHWVTDIFALRGGLYHINSATDEMKAITLGAGLTLPKMHLSIDYCLIYWTDTPSDVDEFSHQLGITYKW